MKNALIISGFLMLIANASFSQDPWKLTATRIDPSNYYGITVANGMIGIVSSPEPFKVKDVVLAGAYDLYGRGRRDYPGEVFASCRLEEINHYGSGGGWEDV